MHLFDPESLDSQTLNVSKLKAFIFPHKRQKEKNHPLMVFIHDKNGHNTIKAKPVATFSIISDQRILTILTKEERSVSI